MSMCELKHKLKALREIVGPKAYHILRCGGRLQVWRRSTPSNWWISSTRSPYDYVWHSSEEPPRYLPDMRMFENVDDGPRMNVHVPFIISTNAPESSVYKLKEKYLP